ncbi:DUF4440 domain-containing protein [Paraburkholderia sediminicola]|uniref:DUF4440 domain-containing protein n=1 Tax=Paraburkholderia metrosideri TaxID=580937 RepID=A0ABW9E1C2_9BURK
MQNQQCKKTESDEQMIRHLNHAVIANLSAGDVAAIITVYDTNAALLMPGAPAFVGIEAISAAWQGLVDTPGISLEAEPVEIEFSESGEMAMDRGWYRLTTATAGGSTVDEGKYLVVWRKTDGQWKMIADMINSNA